MGDALGNGRLVDRYGVSMRETASPQDEGFVGDLRNRVQSATGCVLGNIREAAAQGVTHEVIEILTRSITERSEKKFVAEAPLGVSLPWINSFRQDGGDGRGGGENALCDVADLLDAEGLIVGGEAAVLVGRMAEKQIQCDVAGDVR